MKDEKQTDITGASPTALIWKIDRYATHDGPGIRTNIYFKGCPLRCLWCSNPEGQQDTPELGYQETKCIRCGMCFDACPGKAIQLQCGIPVVDFSRCDHCGRCVSVCPTNALFIYGSSFTLSQIMDIVERDRHIYRRSGGGITCTGGEPLLQANFLQSLLVKCREVGINTAVETCGYVEEVQFREILANIDWLYIDLKHVDSNQHRKLTGRDNNTILRNLRTASSILAEMKKFVVIRQVVVPGFNDASNITALAELAKGLPHIDMIELLPYHAYGSHKYRTLGRTYQLDNLEPPAVTELLKHKNIVESCGICCKIGGL